MLPNNRRGALIEKVKKGSIADAAGKLRPGDEVLEWNGQDLQSKSYEEVHSIISNSRQDEHVRLIVSRPILDPYQQHLGGGGGYDEPPSLSHHHHQSSSSHMNIGQQSPRTSFMDPSLYHSSSTGGSIQAKTFDIKSG